MSPVFLDRRVGLSLSEDETERVFNELRRAKDLLIGMGFLYEQMQKVEETYSQVLARFARTVTTQLEGTDDSRQEVVWSLAGGNIPGLSEAGINLSLMTCIFDWYAINACRLFDVIGHIAGSLNKPGFESRVRRKDYRRKACGPVLVYRNKIAAHYAFVDPEDDLDNPADISLSMLHTWAGRRIACMPAHFD